MAPRFPIQRDQKKRKARDTSFSKPNFGNDGFRSKRCEEYYVTTHKRGIHLRVRPTWRHLKAQNQQPETDEQKLDSLLSDMVALRRIWQIGMDKNLRLEDQMRDLWEDLNLNVMPMRKRTAYEVDQFVDWKPFEGHHIALEEESQEDDTEEDDDESEEDDGEEENESEEDDGEYDEYEMKKAVLFHNEEAIHRMVQVSTENRQRMKDIARQMYEGLRRNDPPITDLKDEEVACLVNWMEFIWRTFFNT